jgi:hypothetical protein
MERSSPRSQTAKPPQKRKAKIQHFKVSSSDGVGAGPQIQEMFILHKSILSPR